MLTTKNDAYISYRWDASRVSPEKSGGGSSRERSFQEHLAATMRKYQGERRRLVRRTVDSCHEKLCRYCGHGAYTARYETIYSVCGSYRFLTTSFFVVALCVMPENNQAPPVDSAELYGKCRAATAGALEHGDAVLHRLRG